MKFRDWRLWLRSLPWALKWFPILVVLRPIVDQFWKLKHISPLLSPLYWVGILTPILCVIALNKFQSSQLTMPVKIFKNWAILVIVNSVFVLLIRLNLNYFILILKITLPVYLFFFLRILIVSKQDLLGILTSFAYSWGIVCLMFLYELAFGARTIEVTRGSLERWEGGFADVLNYAIYAISGVVILTYQFFQKKKGTLFKRLLPALIALFMCILILGKIYHTTSLLCLSVLLALSLFRIFREQPSIGITFVIVVVILYSFMGESIKEESFDPLVEREIQAYEEGTNTRRQFNGRMGRWMDRWSEFGRGNIVGKMIGSGVGLFATSNIIGIAVHNDFLRVIFFTGFIGFFFYLMFYLSLYGRRKYLNEGDKFLLESGLLIVGVYSMTTLPTMYAPFMYFLLSIFVYVSLPVEQLYDYDQYEESPENEPE